MSFKYWKWSHLGDSNSRPVDYKSTALPGYAKVAFAMSGILTSFIIVFIKSNNCSRYGRLIKFSVMTEKVLYTDVKKTAIFIL